jgi:V/A-type H+-transporting ATPase subunit D
MELTSQKKKLMTARRGHKLLKDKRDELMRQFLILARENMVLREEMESQLTVCAKNFALARASMPSPVLDTGLLITGQEISVDVGAKNIMGVTTPVLDVHTKSADSADIYPYGLSFTSGDLDVAVKSLSDALPVMLRLAEVEKTVRLMSYEIEKTRRRVNALEYTVIPEITETIKYISMKLDENERSNQIRLMKVKDMMLEQTRAHEANTSSTA